MNKNENFNHEFLDLRPVKRKRKLFLGEMVLSSRVRLFVLTGLFSFAVFMGLFFFAENRLFVAFEKETEASRITTLAWQLK